MRGILKEGTSFEEDFAPGSGPTPVPASSSQRQSISSPKTSVTITPHATGSRSVLRVRTADRAGVLTGIVGILKDLSVNVVAAEVDTIGDLVDDTFFVTYQGEALSDNMNASEETRTFSRMLSPAGYARRSRCRFSRCPRTPPGC